MTELETKLSEFIEAVAAGTADTKGNDDKTPRERIKELGSSYGRYTTRKFVDMFSQITKTSVELPKDSGNIYTVSVNGVSSLFETLDTSTALSVEKKEITVDANGNNVIAPDANSTSNIIVGGEFAGTPTTMTVGGEQVDTFTKKTYIVNGQNVIINDSEIKNSGILTPDPTGSLVINEMVIDNTNGKLSKNTTSSNSVLKITNGKCNSIKLSKVVLKASEKTENPVNKLYNGIEFWAGEKCKSIVIEKCSFLGSYTHNAINIYSCANNATILVKDCYFDNFAQDGNILRLSNIPTTNNPNGASNVRIIFENCVFSHWDGEGIKSGDATLNEYAGFCLCQDYTSAAGDVDTKNLFGPDKIKITLKNCCGPIAAYGNTGVIPAITDPAEVCYNGANTGFGNQLCYVYRDRGGMLAYDASKYPQIEVISGAAQLPADVVTSL